MSLSESIVSKRKVRPSPARDLIKDDITNVSLSAQATKRLLVYSLSKVLAGRELFPESCFKQRELREGLTASVFRGPQETPATEDVALQHAKRCLDALNCIVPRLNSNGDMADVVFQLFDVKDPQIVYEEWRFEVTYKPLPIPENKKRGSVRSGRLATTEAVVCTAEQFLGIVEKATADIKKRTDGLKLFDFAKTHKDVRFRIGVSLSEQAAQQAPLPAAIFEQQQGSSRQKTHSIEPLLRLRVGTYDLPFHRFEVKVKSTLFKNPEKLDKVTKENRHRKR